MSLSVDRAVREERADGATLGRAVARRRGASHLAPGPPFPAPPPLHPKMSANCICEASDCRSHMWVSELSLPFQFLWLLRGLKREDIYNRN